MMVPKRRINKAKKIALAIPSRFPIAAEKREKVANVNKGKVVRKPAQALDNPNSSRIIGIKGPTAVIEGLRLKESNNMPKNKNQGLERKLIFFIRWE
jgi:hypothetical protein